LNSPKTRFAIAIAIQAVVLAHNQQQRLLLLCATDNHG
jgi:hypothetical protein